MEKYQLFFTVPELAELTTESVSVWRKRIRQGQIPVVKCGRNVRVQQEDFDAFISARRIPAVGEKESAQ